MNPCHIIQKVDKAAGWPTLRKHHDTILLAQAELKNWRAMKNHRQQSDPENQESGPKANQGGRGEARSTIWSSTFSPENSWTRRHIQCNLEKFTYNSPGDHSSSPHNELLCHICCFVNENTHWKLQVLPHSENTSPNFYQSNFIESFFPHQCDYNTLQISL